LLSQISAALGVINIVPALMLDGQHAAVALLEILLADGRMSRDNRQLISVLILCACSLLFFWNLVLAFLQLTMRS
jgi:membrane-associated protease RseP (regulator of RpoE activity)